MKVEFKDVVHLYLGCQIIGTFNDASGSRGYLTGVTNGGNECEIQFILEDGINVSEEPEFNLTDEIKPILRPLSSMTEKEAVEVCRLVTEKRRHSSIEVLNIKETRIEYIDGSRWQADGVDEMNDLEVHFKYLSAPQVAYLLKQGFDLFGLIESGQTIDATTLTVNT